MIFFIAMGGLFTLYAVDLLLLVVVSAIARGYEVTELARKKNSTELHPYDIFKQKREKPAKSKKRSKKGSKNQESDEKASTKAASPQLAVHPSLPSLKLPSPNAAGDETDGAHRSESSQSCPCTPLPPAPEPQKTGSYNMSTSMDDCSSCSASVGRSASFDLSGVNATTINPLRQHLAAPATSHTPSTPDAAADTERSLSIAAAAEAHPHEHSALPSARSVASSFHSEVTPAESDSGEEGRQADREGASSITSDANASDSAPSAPPFSNATPFRTPNPLHRTQGSIGSGASTLSSFGGSGTLASSGGSVLSTDIVIAAEIMNEGGAYKGDGKKAFKGEDGKVVFVGETWPRPAHEYPMVLIQLPMFNEEAHAGLIIERCCAISWPRSRLLIQVLDDSTKAHIRDKVDAAALVAVEGGHPVQVMRRTNRQGYKAGAMVDGLEAVRAWGFKYVAIFDADFEPPVDFLEETIGPLESDPKMGFVQTRWLCPANSFLTWAQKVNLGFHFDVEQRARSFLGWFFNFNGTAGVWRLETIDKAGGWQSDTVVEDMDLSLRAYLGGWYGLYLPHVGCTNEVPDTLATYRTQQFRWLSGPMQILSKAFWTIWDAKNIRWTMRANCYWFFARYILFATITMAVLVVPPITLWVDPWVWDWARIYFVVSVNFALAVYLYITPFSLAYLVFSIGVGYYKAWAMLGGLMGTKKSKSWKVTAKKGATTPALKAAGATPRVPAAPPAKPNLWTRIKSTLGCIHRPYMVETVLALYYLAIAGCALGGIQKPIPGSGETRWVGGPPNLGVGIYCAVMGAVFIGLSFGDVYL